MTNQTENIITDPKPIKENKMGYMPVKKLLFTMSIPMIISMIVQAFYNVVDSIFVAQISENALTAVSLAFPIQNLLLSVAIGVGVGINALMSRSLGEKKFDYANRVAMQGLFLNSVGYILFLIIGIFGTDLYMRSQTNIPEIIDLGNTYVRICCMMSFGVFVQITFERFLLSTGKTLYTMYVQGTGALINIILDPILIFGLLGMPEMGVAGAALATVIGQICAALLAIIINRKLNKEITLKKSYYIPDWQTIKPILIIGVPSILMASLGSVMTFGMNKILMAFSSTAVAVFGVYFKLQSFFFMPVFGVNNGMVPIVAYNYGAKKKDRMNQTIKLSIITAVCIMLVGLAIFQIIPKQLLLMFDASPDMLEIGIPALRIISLSFIFAGFSVMSSSVCQALGHSMYSLYISIGRQLVVLLPVAYILSQFNNLSLVWWAFPIAEIATLIIGSYFLKRTLKKLKW
jgi:putative MATE family efflux protein